MKEKQTKYTIGWWASLTAIATFALIGSGVIVEYNTHALNIRIEKNKNKIENVCQRVREKADTALLETNIEYIVRAINELKKASNDTTEAVNRLIGANRMGERDENKK